MPSLSQFSLDKLNTCDERLVRVFTAVAAIYDIRVLEGARTWARQRQLLMEERTKVGPGESKHNSPTEGDVDWKSRAVDAVPYPIDWKDAKRFTYMAGLVIATGAAMGIKIRWGGNWDMDQVILDDQNFDDLPHFEVID
jgi:peptidoglycan L-alanyl-D-glutamate endopeptidase CwlK